MKSGMGMAAILGAFIFAIIGVALIGGLADSTVDATEAKTVVNETLAFVNGTTVSLANSQLDSFTSLRNGTVVLDAVSDDYSVNLDQGSVICLTSNSSIADGDYDATYVYRNIGDSSSRTLLLLVILFFALAILIGVIAALSPSFREMMGMG